MGAAVGGGNERGRRALAEINVTPLVDVMLVLLIIAMVAAPKLQRGIPLQLPEVDSSKPIEEARYVVSIDREAKIRLNDRRVQLELLQQRMEQLAKTKPDETVYLRADKTLEYGTVLTVMDTIRQAGLQNVGLVTVQVDIPER